MWRDAKLAGIIKVSEEDIKLDEQIKKKLSELEAKKNDKGEIVFDYDDFTDEDEL